MITDDELQAMKERAEKATPGPWTHGRDYVRTDAPNQGIGTMHCLPKDAPFIAHARDDVPKLIAEVERLWEQRSIDERNYRLMGIGEIRDKLIKADAEVERLRDLLDDAHANDPQSAPNWRDED